MSSVADVHIRATETDPDIQAQAAIRTARHAVTARLAELAGLAGLTGLAEAAEPADGGVDSESLSADASLCADLVRRHLAAGDQALYAPASGAARTRELVRSLHTSSAALDPMLAALTAATDAAGIAHAARSLEAALAAHFATEQTDLLPALAALPGVDLTVLAADLQTLLNGGRLDAPAIIDVRDIPHGQRHPRIFARFARLAPGEAFTLVNNHDPKPLHREFDATHPGAFTWDHLESGPEQWRIRIGRTSYDA